MAKTKQYFLNLLLLQSILFLSSCFHSDENNAVIYRISQTQELDSSGAVTSTNTIRYNSNGQVIRGEVDTDNNGSTDTVGVYTYNADGQIIRLEYDNNNDGSIDGTWNYIYNKDDQLIDIKETIGSATTVTTYEYNSNNQVISLLYDSNNDGVIDLTFTVRYNSDGQLADVTGNSIIENYNYDSTGRLLTVDTDNDSDGTIDNISTNSYEVGVCIPPDPISLYAYWCIRE